LAGADRENVAHTGSWSGNTTPSFKDWFLGKLRPPTTYACGEDLCNIWGAAALKSFNPN